MSDESKLQNTLLCLAYKRNGVKLEGNTGNPSRAHHYINYRNDFKDYRALVVYLATLQPPDVVEYVRSRLI